MPTFKDDIIIAGEDGQMYKLSQDNLAPFRVNTSSDEFKPILKLLKSGVSLAAVPVPEEDSGPRADGDAYCYVLNLSSLRKITSWE